jgi:integrase
MLVNFVLIMGNTGLRVGEARGLKWRDLREVRRDNTTDLVLSVAGKTGQREVVASKGEISTYFKRIFELRCEELTKTAGTATEPSPDGFVFCHPDGSPIQSFKKSFASLIKSAGVENDTFGQRRTIYSLRHTYATFRLQEGVNHYTLAKNMGTSVAMLEKYYGHTSNVAAADELTKRKARSPRSKESVTSKPKSGLDWLKS